MASGSPERDFGERSGDDHYVLYTGGTTGMPKGVVWRQEDVFYALGGGIDAYTNERVGVRVVAGREGQGRRETRCGRSTCRRSMHGAAQWGFLRFAFEGNFIVFLRKFDPHEVWRTVEREGINNLSITGDAMARPMIEALEELGGPDALDLSSLFVAGVDGGDLLPHGEGPVPRAVPEPDDHRRHRQLRDRRQRHAHGRQGRHPEQGRRPHRQRRRATPSCSTRSSTRSTRARACRVGSPAAATSPSSTTRTPRSRRRPSSPAPDGMRYALAGDMAIHEADGTITLLGRGSQCINSGGEKIFPEEVEAALKAHPAVFDAIVVGVPDERWGQRVAAVVQPRDGAAPTLDDLDAHCREHVAGYKVPKELHLVAEVVRSPSGKPDYPWAGKVARGEITV